MGQVRTWVLYELRGATRAECFFILRWRHNTLSFLGKCVCECVLCVSVPGLLLHAQLFLLPPGILRLLTPPLSLHTLDSPLLLDLCLTLLSPSTPLQTLRFFSNPALSVALVLSHCLPLSVGIVAQLSGDGSVEVQWSRDYCCTVMLWSSTATVSKGDWASSVCGTAQSLPSSLSILPLLLLSLAFPLLFYFAPQISHFVWKVTKQYDIITLR